MNPHPFIRTWRRTRGSAFVTVLLFTFLLMTLVASIIKWSLSERRLNIRASYWLEARNAAEAVAEYGFSQIATQFSSHANPPSFDPGGSSPLALPPTHSPLLAGDFFYGSHIDPSSLELVGGIALSVPSSGALYLVDANDANNASDTLKGQYVYRRDIRVLAKATVNPPNGDSPVTAYVTEIVSVRGAPLFANAIFYSNNDLEIFPGPQMDIYGPVHCNGNIFLSKQSSGSVSLSFHGPVNCSGDIYHAWGTTATAGQGSGNENLGTDPVNFLTAAGTMVNMKNSSGVWRDSTLGTDSTLFNTGGHYYDTSTAALTQLQGKLSSSFRQSSSQTWGGNVQTAAMGVAAYNPIGTGGQVGVDGAGNRILANEGSVDANGNVIDPYAGDQLPGGYGPHAMIDPPNSSLSTSDTYYDGKHEVESQKYSNQAGLYVEVVVTPGAAGAADTHVTRLFSWPGSAAAAGVTDPSRIGPNGGLLLGTVPSGLVSFVPFEATNVSGTTTGTGDATTHSVVGPSGGKYAIRTTTTTGGTIAQSGTGTLNGSGTMSAVTGGSISVTGGTSTSTTGSYTYTSSSAANAAKPADVCTFAGATSTTAGSTAGATVTKGLYDRRQMAGVNLVQIDMAALRAALNDTNGGTNSDSKAIVDASNNVWGTGTSGGYNPIVENSTGWNGAIYVQVSKSDGTHAAQTSIALANGKVASGSSLVPTVNDSVSGLTVATNAPMYVLGKFNADGNNTTSAGSATTPDDGRTDAIGTPTSAEVPVALAADAITILSPNYFAAEDASIGSSAPATNTDTSKNAYRSMNTASPSASGSTEVAAAFITGLVSTSTSASSGGAHNLPRFLENWGSNTVAIRGSLVSMYRSKIATGLWSTAYYSPPTRNWGFDVIFQNGHFPPLTPKVMSYRRVDFSDLSLNDTVRSGQPIKGYNTLRHELWPSSF